MVREKTVPRPERKEVRYDQGHWALLEKKRAKSKKIMAKLSTYGPIVHGSLARGDIHKESDVDIAITQRVPSYAIEMRLFDLGILRREIVQATPWHLIKGHIYIEENVSVVFPLVKPTSLEEQFYDFGGSLNLEQLERDIRTPGVDKRLMLIEPTEKGHMESAVIGREAYVARKIGVGLQIVKERIDVLSRRDSIGRTGVYLNRNLSREESFEQVLRNLASRDPNIRRRFSGS